VTLGWSPRFQVPQCRIWRAEGSLPDSVAFGTTHHQQIGVLDAAPVVALFGEVQALLGEDRAPERALGRGRSHREN
jgi:hypothetical protein